MATAEFAVALPALVLVGALALVALGCAVDTLRCVDAARATARLLARGDPTAVAVEQGRRLAPRGAEISAATSPGTVTVRVVATARGLGWLGSLSRSLPRPSGDAVAAQENVAAARINLAAAHGSRPPLGQSPGRSTGRPLSGDPP